MNATRREFLGSALAAGAAAIAGPQALLGQAGDRPGPSRPQPFRFVHLTDIHVQPELDAARGFAKALKAVESLRPRPDFILTGGDLVMDVFEAGADRAKVLFDLYRKVLADNTSIPVRHAVGNHDVFGWSTKHGVTPQTPGYGKAMVKDLLELKQTYDAFDHKGWRFFVLDNIQPSKEHAYRGALDSEQREWLENELTRTDAKTPIAICEHIPVLTVTPFAYEGTFKDDAWRIGSNLVCADAFDRLQLIRRHNVKLCLSGHIHQCDRIEYWGTTYINDGAVSGAWWRGDNRGVQEGFGVIDMRPDGTFDYRYHDYQWTAAPPPSKPPATSRGR